MMKERQGQTVEFRTEWEVRESDTGCFLGALALDRVEP
jgi:hypothetical protein